MKAGNVVVVVKEDRHSERGHATRTAPNYVENGSK